MKFRLRQAALVFAFISLVVPHALAVAAHAETTSDRDGRQIERWSDSSDQGGDPSDEWLLELFEDTRDPQAVIGRDDRERISPAFSPVAFIGTLYPNNDEGGCTGTFIGPTVLITAAHCLHNNSRGGWGSRIVVVPGWDSPSMPFGYFDAIDAFIPTGWAESNQQANFTDAQWDYAVVILGEPVGEFTGWMPVGVLSTIALEDPHFMPFTIGYPGEMPETQWGASVPAFKRVLPDFLVHEIDTTRGQSGSAIMRWDDGAIVGISSFDGPGNGQPENYARRVTTHVSDFIAEACAEYGCTYSLFVEDDPPPAQPTPEPPPTQPNPEPPPAPPAQEPPPAPVSPPSSSGAFQNTWARTDQPVALGQANRTWMWGPTAFTEAIGEAYAEAPGGNRTVQYFDKSRMEVTNPGGDPNSIWYVTNGLLVNELMTGRLQLGDNTFVQYHPAQVNVAGDADDATGPTYATFAHVTGTAPLPEGSLITQRIDRQGNVNFDPGLTSENVTAARFVPETNHTVASVFWNFMNSEGLVFNNGSTTWAPLFVNPFYATGYPVTEAYWANVKVGGVYRNVLIQVFERRVLTYTPGNGPGWEVEAGNVGQHYFTWRYQQIQN